jgi:tetratricopeptide (TPR) repeat protein
VLDQPCSNHFGEKSMNKAEVRAWGFGKLSKIQFIGVRRFKRPYVQVAALLLTMALLLPAHTVFAHGVQRYTNGLWFNGQSFEPKTVYVVEGVLRMQYDGKVDTNIDLQGKFIIPPFAEAHNHHFGEEVNYRQQLGTYIQQGIFYSKNTNCLTKLATPVRQLVNRPESIDVLYANGGLTASGGHPVQIYEVMAGQLGWDKKEMENQAYFIIDNEKELEQKWVTILAGKPDFIKTYLEYSEEFEQRKADVQFYGKRGLNPALLAKIVQKAHAEKLPVLVHINTAADFRNAVNAGVDEITHLPLEKLNEEDAKAAARRGVVVVTTTISHRPTGHVKDINDVHRHNLNLLKKSSVKLAIGTDDNNLTVIREAENLQRLGVFDNLGLLKLMTETTPQLLFPNRKLGLFRDGYEASFLALDGNPLMDFANIKKVSVRVKQGHALQAPAEAPKLPSILTAIGHTVMAKDVATAIAEYRQLKKERPQDYDFSERELNALGYQLLSAGRMNDAIEIFKLNVEIYPRGFNAYDSLAEAYMRQGNRELAIQNYKRSLELNPHNANATAMLKKLE